MVFNYYFSYAVKYRMREAIVVVSDLIGCFMCGVLICLLLSSVVSTTGCFRWISNSRFRGCLCR